MTVPTIQGKWLPTANARRRALGRNFPSALACSSAHAAAGSPAHSSVRAPPMPPPTGAPPARRRRRAGPAWRRRRHSANARAFGPRPQPPRGGRPQPATARPSKPDVSAVYKSSPQGRCAKGGDPVQLAPHIGPQSDGGGAGELHEPVQRGAKASCLPLHQRRPGKVAEHLSHMRPAEPVHPHHVEPPQPQPPEPVGRD